METSESVIQRLIRSVKRYLGLQREYVMLTLSEKLARVLTVLLLSLILLLLGVTAVIFLGLTVAAALKDALGSDVAAYGIVTALFALLALLFYLMRNRWLVRPLLNAIASILLQEEDDDEDEPSGQS